MEKQLSLYNTKQVLEMLSISRSALYLLINEGKIKTVKIGRSVRFRSDHVEEFVATLGGAK